MSSENVSPNVSQQAAPPVPSAALLGALAYLKTHCPPLPPPPPPDPNVIRRRGGQTKHDDPTNARYSIVRASLKDSDKASFDLIKKYGAALLKATGVCDCKKSPGECHSDSHVVRYLAGHYISDIEKFFKRQTEDAERIKSSENELREQLRSEFASSNRNLEVKVQRLTTKNTEVSNSLAEKIAIIHAKDAEIAQLKKQLEEYSTPGAHPAGSMTLADREGLRDKILTFLGVKDAFQNLQKRVHEKEVSLKKARQADRAAGIPEHVPAEEEEEEEHSTVENETVHTPPRQEPQAQSNLKVTQQEMRELQQRIGATLGNVMHANEAEAAVRFHDLVWKSIELGAFRKLNRLQSLNQACKTRDTHMISQDQYKAIYKDMKEVITSEWGSAPMLCECCAAVMCECSAPMLCECSAPMLCECTCSNAVRVLRSRDVQVQCSNAVRVLRSRDVQVQCSNAVRVYGGTGYASAPLP
ncbi:hypothetical protein CYMTET_39453 [Cymbomonas tetramitiformis]|uniref:Uncharacterized protein n=1 Tax=Cymbomonas tetramitiformis TaxID=36881 RepID=A0AAE0CA23_9CHLO|nr:hypothetical protein CYMTET_39453 [Cymbomonas tetramitiformis]